MTLLRFNPIWSLTIFVANQNACSFQNIYFVKLKGIQTISGYKKKTHIVSKSARSYDIMEGG